MESRSIPDDNLCSVDSAVPAVNAPALPSKANTGATRELVQVADEEWIAAVKRHKMLQRLLQWPSSPKDEVRQIAAALGVHMATVYRWLSKLRSTNQVSSLLLGKRGMKPGRVLIDPVMSEKSIALLGTVITP